MTLRLILTRHAKSSWEDPALGDHARPLNDRGRRAAPLIGRWLAERGESPTLALSSDATRTVETAELICAELPAPPEIRHRPALYAAAPDTMLQELRRATGASVLVVGHNPGIGALARILVRGRPAHPRFADYPTGATAIIDFPVDDWARVQPGTGTLAAFAVPKDLA